MAERVGEQLSQLIATYGNSLAEDPKRLKAFLRDLLPHNRREANILIAVAEEGLSKTLVQNGGKIATGILVPQLAKTLHDERGIDQSLASWAISIWAQALGLRTSAAPLSPVSDRNKGLNPSQLADTPRPSRASPTSTIEDRQNRRSSVAAQADTPSRIGQNTRYLYNADGTVTDTETGLQWMRCSLDQYWVGETCRGIPGEYDWTQALDAAEQLNRGVGYAGFSDWRVPTLEELNTLTYRPSGDPSYVPSSREDDNETRKRDFQKPTIDSHAFPATPKSPFWSSTSPHSGLSDCAWSIFFPHGDSALLPKTRLCRVRLVRGTQLG